jgi:hypothetical protein
LSFLYWHGRNGKREIVLEGARAEKLIGERTPQLALEWATGSFKRGNECPVRELSGHVTSYHVEVVAPPLVVECFRRTKKRPLGSNRHEEEGRR